MLEVYVPPTRPLFYGKGGEEKEMAVSWFEIYYTSLVYILRINGV